MGTWVGQTQEIHTGRNLLALPVLSHLHLPLHGLESVGLQFNVQCSLITYLPKCLTIVLKKFQSFFFTCFDSQGRIRSSLGAEQLVGFYSRGRFLGAICQETDYLGYFPSTFQCLTFGWCALALKSALNYHLSLLMTSYGRVGQKTTNENMFHWDKQSTCVTVVNGQLDMWIQSPYYVQLSSLNEDSPVFPIIHPQVIAAHWK